MIVFEYQVTSLETSKALQTSGVSQKSKFIWFKDRDKFSLGIDKNENGEFYSAYLATELLCFLPESFSKADGSEYFFNITKKDSQYMVSYQSNSEERIMAHWLLQEALAGMIISLVDDNILARDIIRDL